MKTILALLFFTCLLINNTTAQKIEKYTKGIIVTEQSDTLKAEIKTDFEGRAKKIISYKKGKSEKQIDVENISFIHLEDGISYKRIKADAMPLMAKILVEGEVSLYKYKPSTDFEFLIVKNNHTLILRPIYDDDKTESSDTQVDRKTILIDLENPDSNLVYMYDNCREKLKDKYRLKESLLKKHVLELNDCLGAKVKTYKTQKLIHQFSVLGGAVLKERESLNVKLALSFMYNQSFPNVSKKFNLFVRTNYLRIEGDDDEDEEKILRSVPVLAGVQYKLGLGKVQPYLTFGGGLLFELDDNKVPAFLDLGGGIDFPINYDWSIRADFSLSTFFSTSIGVVYVMRKVK